MLTGFVGGKSRLAKHIARMLPPHRRYIEPFFGAGWVFFTKPKAKENIINDIDEDLYNLYITVRDNPDELSNMIALTPGHEKQFNDFVALYHDKEKYNELSKTRRALVYYYVLSFSFNGLITTPSFSVRAKNPWASYSMMERMMLVSEFLQNTIILNRDFRDVLMYADTDTVVYLDPPYAVTLDNSSSHYYRHKMNEKDHQDLRDALVSAKFRWVLSYDIHPLVDLLYRNKPGVMMYKTPEVFYSSINRHERFVAESTYDTATVNEYLITNFDIMETFPLFGRHHNGSTKEMGEYSINRGEEERDGREGGKSRNKDSTEQ